MGWWRELSDDELRTRLLQRGVNPVLVDRYVAEREDPEYAETIDVLLD